IKLGGLERRHTTIRLGPCGNDRVTPGLPGCAALFAAWVLRHALDPCRVAALLLGLLLFNLQGVFEHYRSPYTLPAKQHTDFPSSGQQLASPVSVTAIHRAHRAGARRERQRENSAGAGMSKGKAGRTSSRLPASESGALRAPFITPPFTRARARVRDKAYTPQKCTTGVGGEHIPNNFEQVRWCTSVVHIARRWCTSFLNVHHLSSF